MSLYAVLPATTEYHISYRVGRYGRRIVKRFYVQVLNEIDSWTMRMYSIYGKEFDYNFLP